MLAASNIPPPMTYECNCSLTYSLPLWNNRAAMNTRFVTSLDIEDIGNAMPFRNLSEVSAFLNGHATVVYMLHDLKMSFEDFFNDARIELSVFKDPEEDTPDHLAVHIQTTKTPKEAKKAYSDLLDNWYLPFTESSGNLPIIFIPEPMR